VVGLFLGTGAVDW